MRSTLEPLEGNKVKLSVEIDEGEFDKAIDAAFRRIAREVRVPGFRPGKAPRRLLEARLGPGVGREEALREALPQYYAQAVKENDVDAIAAPAIDITGGEESGPVQFDAVVEVRPQVIVGGYASLLVTLPRPEASDEDIDAQIERLRQQFGELRPVERPAHDGDYVTISLSGSRDGEPVPGLTADDYLYEVGAGTIASELDDNVRGAKVGDVLEFDAAREDEPDRPFQFRVLVKDVKEKILPDVDDEWANEVSEFETVDELRDDVRRRVSTVRKAQAQLALRERTVEELVKLVDEDAPEPLVNAEMQQRLQDILLRFQAQGIDLERYLQETGKSRDEFVAELREVAAQAVKMDLALRAVADAEELEVTDDDLDAEYAALAERVKQPVARVRRDIERGDQVQAVRSDLRKRKALDWLLDHVEIVDEEGHPIERADLDIATDDAADTAPEARDDEAEEPAEQEEAL